MATQDPWSTLLGAFLSSYSQGRQGAGQRAFEKRQMREQEAIWDEQARLKKKALEDDVRDAQWQMAQSGTIPQAEDVSAMLRAGSVAPRSSNPLAAAPLESAIANLGKYVNADQIGPSPKWGLINGMQYTDPIGPVNSDPNRLPSASYLQPATPQVPMAPPVAPRPPQPAIPSPAPPVTVRPASRGPANNVPMPNVKLAPMPPQALQSAKDFRLPPRTSVLPAGLPQKPAPAKPVPQAAAPAAPPLDILSLFSNLQQQAPAVSLPQPTGRFSQETEKARKIYEAMSSGDISEQFGKSLLAALKFIPERQQEYLVDGKPVMLSDSDYKSIVINANNVAANAPLKQAQTLNALVGANFAYIKSLLYSDEVAATIAQKAASRQLDLSRIPFEQLRPILEAEKIAIGQQNANTARAGQQSTTAHQRVMESQGQQRIDQEKTRGGANPDQGGRVKFLLEQFRDADKKQPGIGTWERLSSLIRSARGHGERSPIKTAFIYSGLPIRAPGGGPSEAQEFVDTYMRGSAGQVMPKVREWYYNGVAEGIPDAVLQKQIIRRLKSGAE